MAAKIVAVAGILIMSNWITMAAAVELETLVMPGKLIAGHADIEGDCDSCHVAFSRDKQRELCLSCHEDVAADVDGAAGYHGRDESARDGDCAGCHTDHQGRDADIVALDPLSFDHALTDFVLTGMHLETECVDCHVADAAYRKAPLLCYDCHAEDDSHGGGLGEECDTCHETTDWHDSRFDHLAEAGYALTGGHAQAECAACHQDDVYRDTPTECYACHRVDDSHEGLNGIECAACHDTGRWSETIFDHAVETSFALTDKHAEVACGDCHTSPVYEVSLSADCYACHGEDDEHDGINGQDCGSCHSTRAWTAVSFDHDLDTGFNLVGAHAELLCAACHTVPVHEASPKTDCYGCHEDDDPHAGQLGESCGRCHGELAWTQSVRFDHGLTDFPLIGAHGDAECAGCHETPRFNDASDRCVDCHRADDIHEAVLGPACGDCHNPVDWPLWEFDHNLQTSFTIDGGHARLACGSCHKRPADGGIEMDTSCVACHRGDDVHRGEFGSDCQRCHTTKDFRSVERIH